MIEDKIKKIIKEGLKAIGVDDASVTLEHPGESKNGDLSTNVALAYSKQLKMPPKKVADEVVKYFSKNKLELVEKVEVAGPGFINFYLSRKFFVDGVAEILSGVKNFARNSALSGKKIMVEYTDPNPFKPFHIGHLMSNAIGESISRLVEFQGAKTVRACYQGDVGLHVAKAIYGMQKVKEGSNYIAYLGDAYVFGAKEYEDDPGAKQEIDQLNKIIFEKSDKKIEEMYKKGREESLKHFEYIYNKLGTKFDRYFFESEVAKSGLEIVRDYLTQNVFEVSDGAVVFRGDKHGLHTRVFINSQGLPTYETKELGLTKLKFKEFNPDTSIVITANEQSDYFKVVLEAMRHIDTNIAERTKHIAHGMLRFADGKMSSRKGNVITGESLISAVEAMVHKKIEERELETVEKNKIAEMVAIGAIKYSILRQATGGDIIYDFEKSISFEGDSGPYLQYSYVRANSILEKAKKEGVVADTKNSNIEEVSLVEKLLTRFPEVVERAGKEYAPHLVATYLVELSSAFNSFYANNQIVSKEDKNSGYKVAVTSAFATVMTNGLWILGIGAPIKM